MWVIIVANPSRRLVVGPDDEFMANWWLVTWTTYGAWLPGDPRGFRTFRGREYVPPPKRYAKAGEQTYRAADYSSRYRQSVNAVGKSVSLSAHQQSLVRNAIVEDVSHIQLMPAILSVEGQHVHFLAQFGELRIRQTVGRLKSMATRRLQEDSVDAKRVWAKGCHMESMTTPHAFQKAFEYVRSHHREGALIYVCDSTQADGSAVAGSSDGKAVGLGE